VRRRRGVAGLRRGIPEHIEIDGTTVEVVRSTRRTTACLEVRGAEVRVRVPAALDPCWIEQFVHSRRAWIASKLRLHAALPVAPSRRYETGEVYHYLGRPFRLEVVSAARRSVAFDDQVLRIGVSGRVADRAAYVRRALAGWYRDRAAELLAQKTRTFSAVVGRVPDKVSVRSFRRRWGSCSASGHIQYNWLLVAAPEPVVDYVVVHELCHLLHLDHSPAFWAQVARVLPDYRAQRRWLREQGGALVV